MVCVPCIFLPIVLAIYLKFIQPYVLRILPQRWANILDPYLYPTCPAKPPPSVINDTNESEAVAVATTDSCCDCGKADDDSKKDC